MLFMQPEVLGRQQLDEALKLKPTLVVGLDFLFWFCYGDGNTSAERLQRFERGLKLLEAVQCPLILGDIPDASGASESMLTPDQIPSAQAMAAANRRLKELGRDPKTGGCSAALDIYAHRHGQPRSDRPRPYCTGGKDARPPAK